MATVAVVVVVGVTPTVEDASTILYVASSAFENAIGDKMAAAHLADLAFVAAFVDMMSNVDASASIHVAC